MSSESQSAPRSRLSKTNRADHENGRYGPSTAESLKQPLTERSNVSLREEVFGGAILDEDRDGVLPVSWGGAVRRWRRWYEESADNKAVFRNSEGDEVRGSDPNRFHPDYADKQYAKLKDLERGIEREYGQRLHTAMLTLTASSTRPGGAARPPVDHLDDLLSSWDAVRRALDHALDGRRYERLAILEPHQSGYLHVHMAVFVDGVVTKETFAPVISAHVRNCDGADRDAHQLEDDDTVSVRHAGGTRETDDVLEEVGSGGGDGDDGEGLDELAIYLAEYLGTYDGEPTEAAEHMQMANAILWATGRQRWRPSNGAQQYMATDRKPPDPTWELVGIEDGEGEVHEVGAGAGGVTKLETWIPDRPPPPPTT